MNLLGFSSIFKILFLLLIFATPNNSGFWTLCKTTLAPSLSFVLLKVSEQQGFHPFEFFELSTNTLKITKDAYDAINALRPVGNRVNLVVPLKNSKSTVSKLIKA